MSKPMPPCGKRCPKRVVGCHSTCPEWAEYKKQCDEYMQARRKLGQLGRDLGGVMQERKNRRDDNKNAYVKYKDFFK